MTSENSSRGFPWRQWTPALIWLGFIFLESSDLFSARNTGSVLYGLVTWLFGPVDPEQFAFAHTVSRKIGHMVGYGVLSFLLFRAWRATIRPSTRYWDFFWAVIAFLMTAAVAALDEWHQTFIPSRTGTLRDVVLDCASALGVQLLIFAFMWNRQATAETVAARDVTSSYR